MRLPAWLPHIDQSPDAMTSRARGYMLTVSGRHLVMAGFIFAAPERFTARGFKPMTDSWPLWAWGSIIALIGVVALAASVWRREALARTGLIASASLSGLVAIGLTIAAVQSPVGGVTGAIIFWALTAKDLIVCQDPIRSPFEALSQRKA